MRAFIPYEPSTEFDWDDVKYDKHKECYLGHTMRAVRPTFNDPKPNTGWWIKGKRGKEAATADLEAVKEQEERLMRQALYACHSPWV